jgi:hypothetical protein
LPWINRNAVGVIMRVAYGYQLKPIHDEFVSLLEEASRISANIYVPGKFWVEFLPICELEHESMTRQITHSISQCDMFQNGYPELASKDWRKL